MFYESKYHVDDSVYKQVDSELPWKTLTDGRAYKITTNIFYHKHFTFSTAEPYYT